MASSAHRLSAELLLPVSFAMSRSILTSLDGAAWSFNLALLLGATLLCRLVDGVLRNLMDIEAGGAYGLAATSPDALVYGLSMLLQLGGSAGVWSMAELLAGVAGSKLTAAAAVGFAPSTLVGLLGIGGTVLAFVLPRVLRAHPNGWLQRIVGFRWLRHQLGQPHSPLTPVHPPRSPMSDFSGAASARSECSPPYSAGSVSARMASGGRRVISAAALPSPLTQCRRRTRRAGRRQHWALLAAAALAAAEAAPCRTAEAAGSFGAAPVPAAFMRAAGMQEDEPDADDASTPVGRGGGGAAGSADDRLTAATPPTRRQPRRRRRRRRAL